MLCSLLEEARFSGKVFVRTTKRCSGEDPRRRATTLNLEVDSLRPKSASSFLGIPPSPGFARPIAQLGTLQSLLPLYSAVASARLTSCLGIDSHNSRSLAQDPAGIATNQAGKEEVDARLVFVGNGAVKVMAKDLIRTRHQIEKFYKLKSQLQGVSLRIQLMAFDESNTEELKSDEMRKKEREDFLLFVL